MNTPKFRIGADLSRTLAASRPVVPAASTAPATPARTGSTNAQLRDAFFQQSGMPIHLRRGPIQRMPLKAAKTNRSSPRRGLGRASGHADEPDFELPVEDEGAEQALRQLPVGFRSRQENDGDRQEGEREERRFDKLFSMAVPLPQGMGAAATASTSATGTIALGSRAQGLKKAAAAAPAPLPELRSMRDVLQLIQSTAVSDPSGASVPLLLRRINAAVLQNKISLPKIGKVAEAREMLIEVFGKGHQGLEPLSSTQRSLHAMLPLWLINLGRERTPLQQTHAAARLSLPRLYPGAMD